MNLSVSRHLFSVAILAVFLAAPLVDAHGKSLDSLLSEEPESGSGTVLNVKDFAAAGDGKTDDSPAFAAALKILAEKGGTLVVPSGTYLVGDLKVGSGTTLKGVGVPQPILMKSSGSKTILDLSGEIASGARHPVHDITIESLTLRGRSVEDGFKEHIHNMIAMGVKALVVRDVLFEAFQGDGLYLGSRFSAAEPVLHNSEVIVANSEFRGVNSQNRNGISIIDCDHCILEHNLFSDLSRSDMPGPIDIEPNQLDEIVEHIIVRENTINGTNGVAGISVSLRAGMFLQSPRDITIETNYIENARTGIRIVRSYGSASKMQPLSIHIDKNTVHGTDHPLLIDGTTGITVTGNDFSHSAAAVEVGCTFVSNLSFTGNRFQHTGSQSGNSIQLCGTLSALNFHGNTFIDTGSAQQQGSAIYFVSGVMDSIVFLDNKFTSPHHVTRTASHSAKSASLRDGKVLWTGNILEDDIQLGDFPEVLK